MEVSLLAVMTRDNGIKILANTDEQRLLTNKYQGGDT
jgi:hypothetical protein